MDNTTKDTIYNGKESGLGKNLGADKSNVT